MARSPLATTLQKWSQRTASARASGIAPSILTPLAQYDINKVAAGGTGMTDQEAQVAIQSAAQGQPVISDPKPKTGLLDILGNVPADVTGIVKGFIPGMVHDISHIGELPGALAKGVGELGSDPAQGFQDIAKAPGLGSLLLAADLIPGVDAVALPLTAGVYGADVAAKATTPAGRQEMAQHPVGTALEAFPGAVEAGKLATIGKEAGAAGSVTEALQQGRPQAALTRALPAGKITTDTGEVVKASVSDRIGELAKKYNIDKGTRSIARQKNIYTRRTINRFHELTSQFADRLGQHTDEEWARIYDLATGTDAATNPNFDPSSMDPHDAAAVLELRKITEEIGQQRTQTGDLVPVSINGKEYLYPKDSSMAKRFNEINRIQASIKEHVSNPAPADTLGSLKYKSRLDGLQSKLVARQKSFIKAIYRGENVPAPLHDFVETRTRHKLGAEVEKVANADPTANPEIDQYIRTNYQADQIQALTDHIQSSTTWQDFAKIVGTRNFYDIYKSSVDEALQLSSKGFDPIYLRHVPLNRGEEILYPKPLSEGYIADRTVKSRVLNFAPHYHNAAMALTDTAREMLAADSSKAFVDNVLRPLSTDVSQLKAQVAEVLKDKYPGNPEGLRAAIARQMDDRFVSWHPSGPFNWGSVSLAREGELAIPKYVANSIDSILSRDRQLEVQGAWDKTLKVYKFSVLTGPRHIIHVGVGGMMFMALRDPLALAKIPAAIRMVRDGEMPAEIPAQLYDAPGENLWNVAAGKSMGRMLTAVPNAMKRFEEFAANVERSAAYLSASSKGLDVEAAALEASKVFVNLDDMTPLERGIIKNVMPFYAFTRHLFRYLMTYPVDHPLRAAVLSRFAEQEQADWKSGLPRQLQQMFFLGSGPNQTAVDFKAINPFRSFGNDFSIAGFASALNPAAQVLLTAVGVNPLTATPELYPQVSYDTQTGTLQAQRPHSGDWPFTIAETFLPPLQAVDHFVGITDRMRALRTSNPEAFRRQLFSALNIPFDVASFNRPLAQEKAEIARYQAAQRAVSAGTKSGDFTEAERYNVVPYRGSFADPAQLAAYWDQIQKALNLKPGVSAKAVLPQYRGKKVKKR